jgi:hypothetical protein
MYMDRNLCLTKQRFKQHLPVRILYSADDLNHVFISQLSYNVRLANVLGVSIWWWCFMCIFLIYVCAVNYEFIGYGGGGGSSSIVTKE